MCLCVCVMPTTLFFYDPFWLLFFRTYFEKNRNFRSRKTFLPLSHTHRMAINEKWPSSSVVDLWVCVCVCRRNKARKTKINLIFGLLSLILVNLLFFILCNLILNTSFLALVEKKLDSTTTTTSFFSNISTAGQYPISWSIFILFFHWFSMMIFYFVYSSSTTTIATDSFNCLSSPMCTYIMFLFSKHRNLYWIFGCCCCFSYNPKYIFQFYFNHPENKFCVRMDEGEREKENNSFEILAA